MTASEIVNVFSEGFINEVVDSADLPYNAYETIGERALMKHRFDPAYRGIPVTAANARWIIESVLHDPIIAEEVPGKNYYDVWNSYFMGIRIRYDGTFVTFLDYRKFPEV
jgi:hypothetical protein